jgi:uncharacterized protein YrrD
MLFKEGANVFTSGGQKVGEIERVVIDPLSKEVTHVIVRKGFLFTKDKVVPISLIGAATEDKVSLREDAGNLEALPDFEETHYIPVRVGKERAGKRSGDSEPYFWYPPVGYTWWAASRGPVHHGYPPVPPFVVETERNVPEGTVALKEGAGVVSADGEHVGDIDAVLTDAKTDRATHLLISQGVLLKETKLVPTTWISTVMEDKVHLVVGSILLQDLPSYEPAA